MNSEVALNVDEQLSRDLAGINSLNEDQLGNLVDLVLSFILDPLNSDFQSGLGRYAETYRFFSQLPPCIFDHKIITVSTLGC